MTAGRAEEVEQLDRRCLALLGLSKTFVICASASLMDEYSVDAVVDQRLPGMGHESLIHQTQS